MKRQLTTEILIIGGGATGVGIAWDAVLRGFKVILVEKRDLTHGTTGRYHGLLHSGARYVVKDPLSARECIQENKILRHTHTHCLEDTGGFFVVTPEDEGDYPDQFQAACVAAGIPCEAISTTEALQQEPLLNPRLSRVFVVPDAAADSFLATHETAAAARAAGATILTYHEVTGLARQGNRVTGATVLNVVTGERLFIGADMVVNAAGAWAGQVAATADLSVLVRPGKGVMLAANQRLVNTVINRCKLPADGDIIVPIHTVSVLGTTDVTVSDPEHLRIEGWEVDLLLTEAEKLIPGISQVRFVRAWAGVRPLYEAGFKGESRDVTRALALLDHEKRDGVSGLLTIVGGKWTTFRLMAEVVLDEVCRQLQTKRTCLTRETVLPAAKQGYYWLGHRLAAAEATAAQADLICECELVTRAMIMEAVRTNPTVTLDDLRRDVRLGMGPCQGGFCTYRATGLMHELSMSDGERMVESRIDDTVALVENAAVESAAIDVPGASDKAEVTMGPDPDTGGGRVLVEPPLVTKYGPDLLLRDFMQERWKGLFPILWGRQLQQMRFDELIYLAVLNADHAPEAAESSPMGYFYEGGEERD